MMPWKYYLMTCKDFQNILLGDITVDSKTVYTVQLYLNVFLIYIKKLEEYTFKYL